MVLGIFDSNKMFFLSLKKPVRITLFFVLLIQLISNSILLYTIPLHYDEWHTLHFFSGNSMSYIFSNYPAPNNHVFYNLVSRIFILMKIDAEIAIRLPSLLTSTLCAWYFFKTCKTYFSSFLSLLLVAMLVSYYIFMMYSIEARGYSFVNLFCILLIYASIKLSVNYTQARYRVLFILSQFLGLFTVPSFLYVMFPIGFLLFLFLLKQEGRNLLLFAGDLFMTAALVIAAYSGILFGADAQNFLNPQVWTEKFTMQDPEWYSNLLHYLDTRFFEIFGFYKLKTAALLILLSTVYFITRRKKQMMFISLLCALFFFSPFLIVLIHQVYPFGRTFYYLLLPGLISFGLVAQTFLEILRLKPHLKNLEKYYGIGYALVIIACIIQISAFTIRHRFSNQRDYALKYLKEEKLTAVMGNFTEIARTGSGNEFYAAEVISQMCEEEVPGSASRVTLLDSVRSQDLLVIHDSRLAEYRPQLTNYSFLYKMEDEWLFLSNKYLAK